MPTTARRCFGNYLNELLKIAIIYVTATPDLNTIHDTYRLRIEPADSCLIYLHIWLFDYVITRDKIF